VIDTCGERTTVAPAPRTRSTVSMTPPGIASAAAIRRHLFRA
jgi:hypothetical protein